MRRKCLVGTHLCKPAKGGHTHAHNCAGRLGDGLHRNIVQHHSRATHHVVPYELPALSSVVFVEIWVWFRREHTKKAIEACLWLVHILECGDLDAYTG